MTLSDEFKQKLIEAVASVIDVQPALDTSAAHSRQIRADRVVSIVLSRLAAEAHVAPVPPVAPVVGVMLPPAGAIGVAQTESVVDIVRRMADVIDRVEQKVDATAALLAQVEERVEIVAQWTGMVERR